MFKFVPDLTKYNDFKNWYREHNYLINFNNIENILIRSYDDELINLKDVIFTKDKIRKNLHDKLYVIVL